MRPAVPAQSMRPDLYASDRISSNRSRTDSADRRFPTGAGPKADRVHGLHLVQLLGIAVSTIWSVEMRRVSVLSVTGLIVLASVLVPRSTGAEDSESVNLGSRFQSEALAAWKQYLQSHHGLEGVCIATTKDLQNRADPARVVTQVRERAKVSQSGAVFVRQKAIPPDDRSVAYVVNAQYWFVLTRRGSASPWAIAQLEDNGQESPNSAAHQWRDVALRSVCPHLLVSFVWLPDLVSDPSFRVVQAERVNDAGRELVRIRFEAEPNVAPTAISVRRGSLLLEPARYWIPHEHDVVSFSGPEEARYTCQIEYREVPGLPPLPRRCVVRTRSHDPAGNTGDHEIAFDLEVSWQDLGDDGFRLPAFGLLEPKAPEPPRYGLWLTLTGLVCLAGAVILRVRRRRMLARAHT